MSSGLNRDSKNQVAYNQVINNKATTNNNLEGFEESFQEILPIIPNQIWTDADDLPGTNPLVNDGIHGDGATYSAGPVLLITKIHRKILTFDPGSVNAFYDATNAVYDCIPPNIFGDTYRVKVWRRKTNADPWVPVPPGQNDWIFNYQSGVLTFLSGLPPFVTSANPISITVYRYEGAKGSLNATGIQGNQGSQGPRGTQGLTGSTGSQGNQGTQGVQGIVGPQGVQGIQGPQGNQGRQGSMGQQGTQGIQGTQGSQGVQGVQGIQGVQGNQGPDGERGPRGYTGDQGDYGPGGQQGNQGPCCGTQGFQGVQGPVGVDGNQGATGSGNQGPAGTDGNQGATGATGSTGNQGATGTTGNQGPAGTDGNQGATGATGNQGDIGTAGNQGPAGTGNQGPAGPTGDIGNQGATGSTGNQGATGTGNQGATGIPGNQGFTGANGNQGIQGPCPPCDVLGSPQVMYYNDGGSLTPTTGIFSDGDYISIGGSAAPTTEFLEVGNISTGLDAIKATSNTGSAIYAESASSATTPTIEVLNDSASNGYGQLITVTSASGYVKGQVVDVSNANSASAVAIEGKGTTIGVTGSANATGGIGIKGEALHSGSNAIVATRNIGSATVPILDIQAGVSESDASIAFQIKDASDATPRIQTNIVGETGIRNIAGGSGASSAIFSIPRRTGDSKTTLYVGDSTGTNAMTAIKAESGSGYAVDAASSGANSTIRATNSAVSGISIQGVSDASSGVGVLGSAAHSTGYGGEFDKAKFTLFTMNEGSTYLKPTQEVIGASSVTMSPSTTTSYHKGTGSPGAWSLEGISNGVDGRIIIISNETNAAMTIQNEAGGATAPNRILTPSGSSVSVAIGAAAKFIYSGTAFRWQYLG